MFNCINIRINYYVIVNYILYEYCGLVTYTLEAQGFSRYVKFNCYNIAYKPIYFLCSY